MSSPTKSFVTNLKGKFLFFVFQGKAPELVETELHKSKSLFFFVTKSLFKNEEAFLMNVIYY